MVLFPICGESEYGDIVVFFFSEFSYGNAFFKGRSGGIENIDIIANFFSFHYELDCCGKSNDIEFRFRVFFTNETNGGELHNGISDTRKTEVSDFHFLI